MKENKTYNIQVQRVYKADFEYESNSIQEIEDMINWNTDRVTREMCEHFWDCLSVRELEQMDVDTTDYKIYEKGKEHPWKRVK